MYRTAFLVSVLAILSLFSTADAAVLPTLIDHGDNTSISFGAYYTPVSISVDIDPSVTNWIAWHDRIMPTIRGGTEYVGSYSWIAVDDFFNLTITNPLGASSTVRMDFNDAWGLSTGPQAVIYGTAAAAPNVARWGAPWSPASAGTAANPKIFDEGGAFNSLFTTAGTYDLTFAWGNTGASTAGHPDMYLLVDETPAAGAGAIPEPASLAIWSLIGVCVLGVTWHRRRKAT